MLTQKNSTKIMRTRGSENPLSFDDIEMQKKSLEPTRFHGRDLASIGMGVEVKENTIPNAGLGLFACREFKRGSIITEYAGVRFGRREMAIIQHDCWTFGYSSGSEVLEHACSLGPNLPIVLGIQARDLELARRKHLGGATYSNEGTRRTRNSTLQTDTCCLRIVLKATKTIQPGEEIFTYYGKGYWQKT
jgi:hypothetical protein